jgi:hypothetical protein
MTLQPERLGRDAVLLAVLLSLHRLTPMPRCPQAWQRRDDEEPGNPEVESRRPGHRTGRIWRPERITNFRSLELRRGGPLLDALIEGRPFPKPVRIDRAGCMARIRPWRAPASYACGS